ncbi:hypothetical protein PROFUN_07729 [Planoprotostelium fungivorum]|uniref:Prohibitin n=1 Tax=Planoprotostelium fungivorum TaxID=1890364 RepID=A0A2P6N1F5_9EUKA|nr:hypothetical protein PROFUN_07729 [Planoprotostelium fungivorum]
MAEKVNKLLGKLTNYALLGSALVTAASSSLYIVQGGYRAVVFDRFKGILPNSKGEGLNFRIPVLQKAPIMYEIRTRATNIQAETGSKDLQTVGVHLRLLYRPDQENLPRIHSRLGPDYDERVLPSIGNEILKAVVAQYDAGELITQREIVSGKIRDALVTRAGDFDILLDDVSITHFSFSREFTNAIESKQVAQQEAERSKFIVLKTEQERRAAVIKAEGEAESARLIIDSLKHQSPGFIELRRIEASKEIAETLSKNRNVTYLPAGTNVFMNAGNAAAGPNNQQNH